MKCGMVSQHKKGCVCVCLHSDGTPAASPAQPLSQGSKAALCSQNCVSMTTSLVPSRPAGHGHLSSQAAQLHQHRPNMAMILHLLVLGRLSLVGSATPWCGRPTYLPAPPPPAQGKALTLGTCEGCEALFSPTSEQVKEDALE